MLVIIEIKIILVILFHPNKLSSNILLWCQYQLVIYLNYKRIKNFVVLKNYDFSITSKLDHAKL